jgi:tetratricopeptide (TPR) repeat protein
LTKRTGYVVEKSRPGFEIRCAAVHPARILAVRQNANQLHLLTRPAACGILSVKKRSDRKVGMRMGGRTGAVAVSLFLFVGGGFSQSSVPPEQLTAPAQAAPGSAPAQQPDHAAAYYHFMLARRYQELAAGYNRSDYADRAVSEYEKAIQADPESLFLRVNLAQLYWRMGRIADAVREAEGVLKANPDQEDAHRLLANLYLQNLGNGQGPKVAKQSLEKAIEHFEALTRLEPNQIDSYVVLGRLYQLNNQRTKAEEVLKKAVEADPTSRNAINGLAKLYFDQGQYSEVVDLLKRIPDGENEPGTLAMLGLAYAQSHHLVEALDAYQKALAQEPDNEEVRRYYAEALLESGKTAQARAELQKLLQADPQDGSTYLRLAQLDRQEGHFDQARKELDRAKALLPDDIEVPYQEVLLEEALGNEDKAVSILQELLKQSEKPEGKYTVAEARDRAIFLERLGLIYRNQEKYDQALDAFRQIVALGQNQEPQGEALIIDTLRLSHQPQKALEEANAALQKYPKDRSLKLLRASLLGQQGKVDEAVQSLERELKGGPQDRDVYVAIAQIYSDAKRYKDAEAVLQKALAADPKVEDQEFAIFLLGSVYERQKKYDAAEEQFKKVLAQDPLNAAAANYLGYLLADRGIRLDESVKYIQRALQIEPNNGAYLDSLGWAYYKMKRYDLAQPPLEKAARLMRTDPTILEHLGKLYLAQGKTQEAEEQWERALKVWPNAVGSDFDAEEAARLQKQLDELKLRLARQKAGNESRE